MEGLRNYALFAHSLAPPSALAPVDAALGATCAAVPLHALRFARFFITWVQGGGGRSSGRPTTSDNEHEEGDEEEEEEEEEDEDEEESDDGSGGGGKRGRSAAARARLARSRSRGASAGPGAGATGDDVTRALDRLLASLDGEMASLADWAARGDGALALPVLGAAGRWQARVTGQPGGAQLAGALMKCQGRVRLHFNALVEHRVAQLERVDPEGFLALLSKGSVHRVLPEVEKFIPLVLRLEELVAQGGAAAEAGADPRREVADVGYLKARCYPRAYPVPIHRRGYKA